MQHSATSQVILVQILLVAHCTHKCKREDHNTDVCSPMCVASVLAIHAYSAEYAARARVCKFEINCKGCDACNSLAAMQTCMPQHDCCTPAQFCIMNELELRHELHGVERILHCLTG